jgi:hypothetical protein
MGGNVSRMREMRNAYKILVEKPEGKRPLGIFVKKTLKWILKK